MSPDYSQGTNRCYFVGSVRHTFPKRLITSESLQILLSYLVCMCFWTTPFHAHQLFDPCDLDLELEVSFQVSKSATAIQKKGSLLLCPFRYCFHIWYACVSGHHLSMRIHFFDPCDLELEVSVQVLKSATAFQKMLITTVSLQILLSYLVCMCIWTTLFHAHKMFDPCDLDLELKVNVQVFKSATAI